MAALYNRLYSYVASTVLSDVILAALVDQLPSFPKNSKEKYVIGTVSISLIFWFIFTVGDIVDSLINVIIGNVVENGEYNFREQTRRNCTNKWIYRSLMIARIFGSSISNHLVGHCLLRNWSCSWICKSTIFFKNASGSHCPLHDSF